MTLFLSHILDSLNGHVANVSDESWGTDNSSVFYTSHGIIIPDMGYVQRKKNWVLFLFLQNIYFS